MSEKATRVCSTRQDQIRVRKSASSARQQALCAAAPPEAIMGLGAGVVALVSWWVSEGWVLERVWAGSLANVGILALGCPPDCRSRVGPVPQLDEHNEAQTFPSTQLCSRTYRIPLPGFMSKSDIECERAFGAWPHPEPPVPNHSSFQDCYPFPSLFQAQNRHL